MITTFQFKSLDDIFTYYNQELFNAELPQCIINMSRLTGAAGFYSPDRWKESNKNENVVDEISINPDHMNRPDLAWHSTLVHEMCHLWQFKFGKPSRSNYHNKQFSVKMEEVGLITSQTGYEGGARTGQGMTHYVQEGGAFQIAFLKLVEDENYKSRLFFVPNKRKVEASVTEKPENGTDGKNGSEGGDDEPKKKSKIKYSCSCGCNVWGKANLSFKCNECGEDFKEQE